MKQRTYLTEEIVLYKERIKEAKSVAENNRKQEAKKIFWFIGIYKQP